MCLLVTKNEKHTFCILKIVFSVRCLAGLFYTQNIAILSDNNRIKYFLSASNLVLKDDIESLDESIEEEKQSLKILLNYKVSEAI